MKEYKLLLKSDSHELNLISLQGRTLILLDYGALEAVKNESHKNIIFSVA